MPSTWAPQPSRSIPGDYTDKESHPQELADLLEQLKTGPPDGRVVAGPEEASIAGALGATVRFAYQNGVEVELAFVFLEDGILKAEVLRWPGFESAVPPGYAVEILDRMEWLKAPPPPP